MTTMTDTHDRTHEFYEIGEWDWWDTNHGNRLHAATVQYDPKRDVGGDGITACGLTTELWIPGLFSRMDVPRCKHCCNRLGYPQGIGSPKNDKACRPLVKQRLAQTEYQQQQRHTPPIEGESNVDHARHCLRCLSDERRGPVLLR